MHRLMVCEKWRRARLRLVHPVSRNVAMRVFGMMAMVWGAVPVRRVDASSLNVTSRTQWTPFSMAPQCPPQDLTEGFGVCFSWGEAGDAVGDLFGAPLPVEVTDVADDTENLGCIRKVDRRVGGDGRGTQDAFFGAAMSSRVLGGEIGRGRGQHPRRSGQQARVARLDRHEVVLACGTGEVCGGFVLGVQGIDGDNTPRSGPLRPPGWRVR